MSVTNNFDVMSLVERATEMYAKPEIVEYIGDELALSLQLMASHIVAAEVRQGVAYIPEAADEHALPIVVVKPGQSITMSRQFYETTTAQREAAIQTVTQWRPNTASATDIVDQVHDSHKSRRELTTFTMKPNSGAFVTAPDALVASNKERFANLPDGFAIYYGRPLVVAAYGIDLMPDVFAHELKHVEQRLTEPVRVFESQNAIDMQSLRDELHGYHIGATVRIAMEGGEVPRMPYSLSPKDVPRLLQIGVDSIRAKHNKHCDDEFRPTVQIRRDIKRTFGVDIVHDYHDFDKIMADFRKYSSFEVE